MANIMLVDDDSSFTDGVRQLLSLDGHKVSTADTVASARRLLGEQNPEALLLDLFLPDGSGLELLEELGEYRPRRVVVVTGHPAVKSVISSLSGPAVSYLTKPIEPAELRNLVSGLDGVGEDEDGTDVNGGLHFGLLRGESEAMQTVYRKIEQVAQTDSTVLIQGESGTGKELVAAAVHKLSRRAGAFVPVNCGGLSKELIQSELFGHEKGSFTGANRRHAGFFERANAGTLFLDEITEMPVEMQTHLLRALETRRIARVGGEGEIAVDTRLLAATNRNPAEAVAERALREDLYFRLRVFPIELPPLRARTGDVRILAEGFLEDINREQGTARRFVPAALERFEGYHWPGNVRELKHTVQRAYISTPVGGDTVQAPDGFEYAAVVTAPGIQAGRSIREVERELIMTTLDHFQGDKRSTAETLGISLKTLYNRLNEYSAEDEPAERG